MQPLDPPIDVYIYAPYLPFYLFVFLRKHYYDLCFYRGVFFPDWLVVASSSGCSQAFGCPAGYVPVASARQCGEDGRRIFFMPNMDSKCGRQNFQPRSVDGRTVVSKPVRPPFLPGNT
ncbi:hypothetical protein E2C01_010498 [Portunus trituberculatus]|uniref:Uncharacterized protein n=1 Tax=Portunus trituberculatus TaxID=210409 RepID=A0A5B7D8U3_PORTR|nr:hypothetical protein [Portunus trituberculatus]